MNDINLSLAAARATGSVYCAVCDNNDKLFAPMEKLSIALFGRCSLHLDDDSIEQKNLLKISELI